MSSLAKRVRMGTTLAVAAAGLLWLHPLCAPGVLALAVVSVLALLSSWELDRMGSFRGRKLGTMLYSTSGVACVALGFILLRDDGHDVGPVGGLVGLYAIAGLFSWPWLPPGWPLQRSPQVLDGRERLPLAREVVPLALWLIPPLFSIVLIDREFGTHGLVALVVLAKVGDNAGYFVGRAIGKRHPFPQVSPGKTVAGCVASLVAGIVVGAALLPFTLGAWSPAQAALGGLVGGLINVAAQTGDLSESWVKRRAGVKDSSALLGPSGGVLDVIDSLLLAAPVALIAWSLAYGTPIP